jgi:hypothetical protein
MDHDLFDRLTISLANREALTRRAVGAVAAAALGLGIGGLMVDDAEAKSCRRKCKKKNTKRKRRRCRKRCRKKGKCTADTDCGDCETCTNRKCVAECPADRCVTDPSGDICCPEGFIACGLACCGGATPICSAPGTCTAECTTDTDCGDCETCTSGVCVSACTGGQECVGTGAEATCCDAAEVCGSGPDAACCPADRCISDVPLCCPEDYIACGLACCGGDTPVCVTPGTCGPATDTCPGGTCTGGPGVQGSCASATCNCNGDPGTCVTCLANNVACSTDDECCGAAVCCLGAGNTCQNVCI